MASDESKLCTKCKTEKPIVDFPKTRRHTGILRPQSWCKACKSEAKKQRALTPNGMRKLKDEALKRFFGITVEDFDLMHASQNGLCAICNKPQSPRNRHGQIKQMTLAVDHCHKTGIIRGLLCDRCNVGLGSFSDDVEVLKKAIVYLESKSFTGMVVRENSATKENQTMRKEFTMTKEQCEKLLDACKPVPYMVIGGVAPRRQQQNANDAWCALGREMGFDGMTVKPVAGKGIEVFTAEVTDDEVASDQITKFFNDRHDARVAAGNKSLYKD